MKPDILTVQESGDGKSRLLKLQPESASPPILRNGEAGAEPAVTNLRRIVIEQIILRQVAIVPPFRIVKHGKLVGGNVDREPFLRKPVDLFRRQFFRDRCILPHAVQQQ